MCTFNRRRPRVVNTAAILATAITLLTSSVKSQGLVTGIATRVTASTTCSNQFASIHASKWSSGNTITCGQQCIQLWQAQGNPEPKIMVQVVGVCQQCEPNDLELSSEPFDALDKNNSSLVVQWQMITCPEALRGDGTMASITNVTISPNTSSPSSSPPTTTPSPSLPSSPQPTSSNTSIPSSSQSTSSPPSSVNGTNGSHASNTSQTPSPTPTLPRSRRPPSNTTRLPSVNQGTSPQPSSLGNENDESNAAQTPYPNTQSPNTPSPNSPSPVTSSPSTPSPNSPTSKPHTSSPATPTPSTQPATATPSPSNPFTPQPGPRPTSTPSSSPSTAKDNAQGSSPMPSIAPSAQTDRKSRTGSSDHQDETPDSDKRTTRRPAYRKRFRSTDGSLTSYSGSGSSVTDSNIGDVTSKPPPKQGDTSRKGSSGGDNGPKPTGSSSGGTATPGITANDTNTKTKFFTGGFFTSPIFIGLFMGLIGFVGLVITYRAKKQRYSNSDHDQIIPNTHSPSVSAPLGGVGTSRAMYTLTSPINIRSAISTL